MIPSTTTTPTVAAAAGNMGDGSHHQHHHHFHHHHYHHSQSTPFPTTVRKAAWTTSTTALLLRGGGGSSETTTASVTSSDTTIDSGGDNGGGDASSSSVSIWSSVPLGPPDAILGIAQAFKDCTDPHKVNVCVGAYRDNDGQPWILPSVLEAEERLLRQSQPPPPPSQLKGSTTTTTAISNNKEYLPIEGDAIFIKKAMQFAYGTNVDLDSVAAVQTLSGTGACRIGGHFLAQFARHKNDIKSHNKRRIYIPVPTWGNHWSIFEKAGLETKPYRYYDPQTNGLDFAGLLQDLREAPNQSIILLHACAHNPTGCDPTRDQWQQIASVLQQKRHVAFFDSAYQGFASGDAERDAWAVRYFVSLQTIPVLLAQSFAKNFGLYGERCGTLSVICANQHEKENILSQLRLIIRPMYSSPPKHGSSIVRTILTDDALQAQYRTECRIMAQRLSETRTRLVEALTTTTVGGSSQQHHYDWSHLASQIGMFAYTGHLTPEMCDRLTNDYSIYLTRDGRISLAGLNDSNLQYVASAIHAVTNSNNNNGQ